MAERPDRPETPELAELLKAAIKAGHLALHTAIPAKVERYIPAEQRADIQPLIKTEYFGEDEAVDLPVIPNVPVQWPSANAGGAYIHLPLKTGDYGILVFSERSLDRWLSSDDGSTVDPEDTRHHNLSDGMFVPGIRPFKQAITGLSADDLMIVNGNASITLKQDGTVTIDSTGPALEIKPDGTTNLGTGTSNIAIDSAGNVVITAGLMSIEMDAVGQIKFTGAAAELMTILDSLMTNLINATVQDVTPLPFTAATIALLTVDQVNLNLIRKL